jgi:sn-glycerol 3-phosphate transport system ATP-binding protein
MSEISIRNVTKAYGKNQVVDGVDLAVSSGEFMVILGPSGCGKSTLLRMIAGLEQITSGEISIGSRVVNRLEPRERGCAMVFQNYALYPHMTVAENIGYALRVAGLPRRERLARVRSVAESLGLTEFIDRKPGQLSGGQRQRVAMGRAMIREPKVFLYDEPLSNLDAKLRVAMRVEIRKLHQKLGTTTLFVTHDQVEAMTLADRIVVMNKGIVEQVGTPAEVYHQPQSTYVASFVGTPGMNLLPARVEAGGALTLMDGQKLYYDTSRWPAASGEVLAGFRAERAQVAHDDTGLRTSYQFSEELGASRLLHLELNKAGIIVQHPDTASHQFGTSMHVIVPRDAIDLFDAKSGRRLTGEVREGMGTGLPTRNLVAA